MQLGQHHSAEQMAELVIKALKYLLSTNPAMPHCLLLHSHFSTRENWMNSCATYIFVFKT